jgi:hypothetical protein
MTMPAGPRYFYLSYMSAPSRDERFLGDPWIRRFYHELVGAIAAEPGDRLRLPGFADFTVRKPEDRPEHRRLALAGAEVFVALYSPDYLNSEELRKEREFFRQKLINVGRPADGDNVLPVLWSPLQSPAHSIDREQAELVAADVKAYTDNGLSALCRMRTYHNDYQAVLGRLARQIVSVAEGDPLRPIPSAVEPVDVPRSRLSEVPFLAVVLAPDQNGSSPDRAQSNGYFEARARHWQPFYHGPPIVTDVAAEVQRLRMPIEISEFSPGGNVFENAPGLLLIDPYIVAGPNGPEIVRAAVACLRSWIGVAIVADENSPSGGARELAGRVAAMFPDTANVTVFSTYDDWRTAIHTLVERLRRRYLMERPAYPPVGRPSPRPRLFEGRPPPDERSVDHPPRETE